ncbi:MAG: adenylate/guanylate cyclase domain-containing protein, partial [Cyanobacteria bacterium J06632_3]
LVEQLNTSILLHPVETASVESALSGTIATEVIDDYRGVSVLSSYAPLRLRGLRWIILAEMDHAEAFGPVTTLQIYMGILGVILVLLVAWLSNFAAQNFVSPIQKLLDITDRIRSGERDIEIEIGDDSRLDQLEDALQNLLADLQVQENLVVEKTAANAALLNNMMPSAIASRMGQEGRPVVDTLQQVTLLVVRIVGLGALAEDADDLAIACDHILRQFDEKARYYGLDTQLTVDNTYIATCGVSQVFLDHQERSVDFALELVRLAESNQSGLPPNLDLQIGIHTGPVVSGVLGRDKFMYKLLGNTLTVAQSINQQGGASNSILVTKPIYERLKERYLLVPRLPVWVPEVGAISAWMIFTRTERFDQQVEQVQASYQELLTTGEVWANHFFDRLLALAPNCQTCLPGDATARNAQASNILQTLVKGLSHLDLLLPTLQDWGRQVTAYDIGERDFDAIGEALIWSLERSLFTSLSPDVKQSWVSMETLLSGVIREAAMEPTQAGP